MIEIDSRKELFPYSEQCRKCENLKSEENQDCKVYGVDIPDDFWTSDKKCPKYTPKPQAR